MLRTPARIPISGAVDRERVDRVTEQSGAKHLTAARISLQAPLWAATIAHLLRLILMTLVEMPAKNVSARPLRVFLSAANERLITSLNAFPC